MARVLKGRPLTQMDQDFRLDNYLFNTMELNSEALFVTNASSGVHLTFGETLERARGLAARLNLHGYGVGDVLAFFCNNSEDFVVVFLAALRARMTVAAINPAARTYDLDHYFNELKPVMIFAEASSCGQISDAAKRVLPNKPGYLIKDRTGDFSISQSRVGPTSRVPADVAVILFSSGTTGLPKGVMLTHRNIVSHLVARQDAGPIPAYVKRCLALFPMYHSAGMCAGLLFPIVLGTHQIIMEKYSLEAALKAIQDYKPECILIPPSVVVQMSKTPLLDKYDVTSVKCMNTGAAPVKRETEEAFKARFNYPEIGQAYGMTETVGGVIWKTAHTVGGNGSVGKLVSGSEIKIVDPETGELLGCNTRGEVWIRSPLVMKGYINQPEATRSAIDAEGWLRTGDLGFYDDEEHLYVVDRIKELIKYKGNQVAPAELEALLLEHPSVSDVGVVGVPDDDAGELPRAYVVGKPNCELTGAHIQNYVNEHVSNYKRLRGGVIFVPEIPKLSSGKILRRKLKELVDTQSKL